MSIDYVKLVQDSGIQRFIDKACELNLDFTNLKVYTGVVQHKSVANFDITVMTGDIAFAPTWEMVRGIKSGSMSFEDYTEKYLDILYESTSSKKASWESLIRSELSILVCYCSKDSFCHRFILAEVLKILGAQYCGEVEW